MTVLGPVISSRSDYRGLRAGRELPFYARDDGAVPPRACRERGEKSFVAAAPAVVAQLGEFDDQSAVFVAERESVRERAHDEDAAAALAHGVGAGFVAEGLFVVEAAALV